MLKYFSKKKPTTELVVGPLLAEAEEVMDVRDRKRSKVSR